MQGVRFTKNTVKCPSCGSDDIVFNATNRPIDLKCWSCHNHFTKEVVDFAYEAGLIQGRKELQQKLIDLLGIEKEVDEF